MRQLTGGKRDTIYTPAVLMLVIIVGISGFTPGLPFFIGGLTCFAACLILLLPGLARQFHSAHQKMSDVAQFIAPEIAPEEEAIKR